MRTCKVTIEGISPYSASRNHEIEFLKAETHEAYDARTWADKCHFDEKGNVSIPGSGFKLSLDAAASHLSEKVKGSKTYTKIFEIGISAAGDLHTKAKRADLKCEKIFVHVDGNRKANGKRIMRHFPVLSPDKWGGTMEFWLIADNIPEEVFERTLRAAGLLIGVGRGRPGTGCPAANGRFRPAKFEWGELAI